MSTNSENDSASDTLKNTADEAIDRAIEKTPGQDDRAEGFEASSLSVLGSERSIWPKPNEVKSEKPDTNAHSRVQAPTAAAKPNPPDDPGQFPDDGPPDCKFVPPRPFAEYLSRIGASLLNFRRGMIKIKMHGSYYFENVLIEVLPNGSLRLSDDDPEYAPTPDEIEAIKAAFIQNPLPKSIRATESSAKQYIKDQALRRNSDPDMFFPIRCRKDGKIIMIQQRVDPEEGGDKYFLPHSLWSDGVWRTMEPDGALPFWKPKNALRARIMVHEGAKAARHMDWLLHDRSPEAIAAKAAHPWAGELELYEHWGILGGALAPHRADYAELRREKPIEVVYVCDNDWPGKRVLQRFSELYRGKLRGVMFDQRFPAGFDLADAMPGDLFDKKTKRWIGPPLKSFVCAATYATDQKPNSTGKGRPFHVMRREFLDEWSHVVASEVFINELHPDLLLNAKEFNSTVRPFSGVDNTARLMVRDAAGKAAKLSYHPANRSGVLALDEVKTFNTHRAPDIRITKGDAAPWLEYVEKLIPDEGDRMETLRWLATLIARPGIKMSYGLLLISETQGTGKTTLGERVLTPLVGRNNVSYPSESDVVDSSFNAWLAHKRLAIVNEIYAGASAKAYNRLKSVITDKTIDVNRKFMEPYSLDNWIHVFACSNSKRALKMSIDDRRWLVPGVTEERQTHEYWVEFHAWLGGGGLGIIKGWADDFLISNSKGAVKEGDHAPESAAKRDMVEEGWSPGEQIAARVLRNWAGRAANPAPADDGYALKSLYTTDRHVQEIIKNELYGGKESQFLESQATIRKVARACGWHIGEKTQRWGKGKCTILTLCPELAKCDPNRIGVSAGAHIAPLGTVTLEAERKAALHDGTALDNEPPASQIAPKGLSDGPF